MGKFTTTTKLIFKKKREKRKKYRQDRRERKIAEIEQHEKEGNAHEKEPSELSGVAEGRVEKRNPETIRRNLQRQRKRVIHFFVFPKFWEFGF